jgi:putative membrane protein
VLRGFTAYFLERSGIIGSLSVPSLEAGVVSVQGFALAPGTRLAVLVIGGVLVSILGVRLAARADTDDPEGLLD